MLSYHKTKKEDELNKKTVEGLIKVLVYLKKSREFEAISKKAKTVGSKLMEAITRVKVEVGLSETTRIIREDSKWTHASDRIFAITHADATKVISVDVGSLSKEVKCKVTPILDRIYLPNSFKLSKERSGKLLMQKAEPIRKVIENSKNKKGEENLIDVENTIRLTNGSKTALKVLKSILKKNFQVIRSYRFTKEVIKSTHERGNSVKLVARKGSVKPFSVISVKGETLRRSLVDYSTPKAKDSSKLESSRVTPESLQVHPTSH
eukprot:TRINITY_DN9652_c0_g2_i2.p1 TRINITY_DN9652_c0_g2~~TRINITY_DN9652_c0_g2_i2.p1  ORF type:complete len:264 (-),score=54.34 TRINITY_DN9652_c0_g2_i2:464-1255(-)